MSDPVAAEEDVQKVMSKTGQSSICLIDAFYVVSQESKILKLLYRARSAFLL
jgi:hypothetical protein